MYSSFRIMAVFFAILFSQHLLAEDFTFVNKTDVDVDYQLAHWDLEIKTTGSVLARDFQTHTDLSGWGERAILVWSRNGKLLYAGKGGSMQEGFNLTLTLRQDPRKPGEFTIVPALSR